MPVVVTIAAVSALFGSPKGSRGGASLLDPPALRAKLAKLPDTERRTNALALVDRLDRLAKERDAATATAMRAYVADVESLRTDTDRLAADFALQDRIHEDALRELLEVRQALIDTLMAEEWKKVFG
jgi:hypothetical protein